MPGLVPYVMIMLLVYITVKTTIHRGSRESICSTLFVTSPICLCHKGQESLNLLDLVFRAKQETAEVSGLELFVVDTSLKKRQSFDPNLPNTVMKLSRG